MMMKSSSWVSSTTLTSGWPVMVCRWYSSYTLFLQQRSPRQRDRLRWLLMRPFSTFDPEATMRSIYSGFSGLWSKESSMMDPPRLRAARESPALATQRRLPTMSATLAVHPTDSATLLFSKGCMPFSALMLLSFSSPCSEPRRSSMALKVCSSASSYSPRWKASLPSSTAGKCSAQNCETSTPPCPSKTAKRKISLLMRLKSMASSMCFLQPVCNNVYLAFRS